MRSIALDVMGGDEAPQETIASLDLLKQQDLRIILVGKPDVLSSIKPPSSLCVDYVEAQDVVEMSESAALSYKQKPNSSIRVGLSLVKEGKADAFVSAGNTGAVMSSALLSLGRIKGIHRPAIATLFPTLKGQSILLDMGATVDCKPEHLLQFAWMGHNYAKLHFGIKHPRIGLFNIGEEAEKGNELTLQSYQLLKESNLNFVGNVEGKGVFFDAADVIVCDGFVGNALLKLGEGLVSFIFSQMKTEMLSNVRSSLGAWLLKPGLKRLKKKMDYEEFGGAPLLGVKGVCMIAHGRSKARAIKNAIIAAKDIVDQQLVKTIEDSLSLKKCLE